MSCKVKELILNGIKYNTSIQEDRSTIGKYYELKLLSFFIDNNVDVKYITDENKYSSYDFNINMNNKKYIVELKSRLNSINNFTNELICSHKLKVYKKLINKNKDTKILFIFNHIITEYDFKFYYYIVDLDKIDDVAFLNYDCYDKPTYELPIQYIKPLEELF